jgi:Trypsin-like peptidase domain
MQHRISKFPLHKPFDRQPSESDFQRVVLRLVVGFNTTRAYVVGTATVVCGHLLLTARHVIEEVFNQEGVSKSKTLTVENSLVAFQIVPGPEYVLWHVVDCWLCPQTDLAFLHVASEPSTSATNLKVGWMHPRVRAFPPAVGETVAAMGYRKSSIDVSKNDNGGLHHELNDELIASVGIVREVFATHRDRGQLSFPCYQVSARFDAGMSGGPVFDESGALCGLICSNVEGSHIDGEPISYVTTLWPMFLTVIQANRGDAYPLGDSYPVFELARDGFISVVDFQLLAAAQPPPSAARPL